MSNTFESVQDDLRRHVAAVLIDRANTIAADTVAMFPYTGGETPDSDHCARLSEALIRLLASTIRDGADDAQASQIANLRVNLIERAVEMEQVFTFAYLIERTALDELALDDSVGATTERWPLVAQLVRSASFDYLASLVAHARFEPTSADIIDSLTTLHTRRIFDAVLAKETDRAGRFGYAIALILFDVDQLSTINERHGFGVGNRILERLGILMRKYFRQHDWVARYSDDEIAVLLSAADAEHAGELAERARLTVEGRLAFTDHRTGTFVPVTVTAAVVNVPASAGAAIDPERLLIAAEDALKRAKQAGRNRVELVSGPSTVTRVLPRNSPSV